MQTLSLDFILEIGCDLNSATDCIYRRTVFSTI